jgi:hypothetical protein
LIEERLASVVAATPAEIIVVDGCSTDRTLDIVGGLWDPHPERFHSTFAQLMAQDALMALIGQEPPTDTRYPSGVR